MKRKAGFNISFSLIMVVPLRIRNITPTFYRKTLLYQIVRGPGCERVIH